MLTLSEVLGQVDRVTHVVDGIEFRWNVTEAWERAGSGVAAWPLTDCVHVGFFIQMEYDEADIDTGEIAVQRTRKWHVPLEASTDEVLQSCLRAALGSAEHRVREWFLVDGVRAYGPHQRVERLIEASRDA